MIKNGKVCKTVGELIEHLKQFNPSLEILINGVDHEWQCEGTTNPFCFQEDSYYYMMDKSQPDLCEECEE